MRPLGASWPTTGRCSTGVTCPRSSTRSCASSRRWRAALPGGYRFTPAKDLADEIEWAKVRRMSPDTYAPERDPPVPPTCFTTLWRRYEQAKARADRIDFEDMLTARGRPLRTDADALALRASALCLVQRRRVPGHEPAPGGSAASLARRPTRPVRGRRPGPDDLQLHRRLERVPRHVRRALPGRTDGPPQPQLPEHAAGARARQPAHPRARAACRRRHRRAGAGARPARRRRGRARGDRRRHPRARGRWRAADRDRRSSSGRTRSSSTSSRR